MVVIAYPVPPRPPTPITRAAKWRVLVRLAPRICQNAPQVA